MGKRLCFDLVNLDDPQEYETVEFEMAEGLVLPAPGESLPPDLWLVIYRAALEFLGWNPTRLYDPDADEEDAWDTR